MRVLICGGGVIGASIACFLSRRGAEAVVIERTGVACAASGKSGGFLALDWCDGTPLAPLARRSFALHARLAEELGNGWGYRRLDTYSGYAGIGGLARRRLPVDWLAESVLLDRQLGGTDTTAQVHPAAFTAALLRAAQAQGAELRAGEVTGILKGQGDGRVAGVEVDGQPVAGDAVVIAMGPWSILAARWLPLPGVFGLKGHSLVFETGASIPPRRSFSSIRRRAVRCCRRSCSRAPTAPPMSAPSPARAHCPSTPRRWHPIPAPSTACRRCAAPSRPRSPARPSWPARPAFVRLPRMGCR
jgi:glycine/D-amino acid oxidase-like deaminating enzyme